MVQPFLKPILRFESNNYAEKETSYIAACYEPLGVCIQ